MDTDFYFGRGLKLSQQGKSSRRRNENFGIDRSQAAMDTYFMQLNFLPL
jgi:hypothetical protein